MCYRALTLIIMGVYTFDYVLLEIMSASHSQQNT